MGESEQSGYRLGDSVIYGYLKTPGTVVGFDGAGRLVVELESESRSGTLRVVMSPRLVERPAQAA